MSETEQIWKHNWQVMTEGDNKQSADLILKCYLLHSQFTYFLDRAKIYHCPLIDVLLLGSVSTCFATLTEPLVLSNKVFSKELQEFCTRDTLTCQFSK